MISFSINPNDLSHACKITSKGWYFNLSKIEPFIHPSLEFFAVTDGNQYLFCVRERNAFEKGESTKIEPFRQVMPGEINRLRANLKNWELHYVCLLIDSHSVTMDTGKWPVSPIHIVEKNNELHGSWNPNELYKHFSSFKLNKELVSHFLISFDCPYSKNTLFLDMYRLTERSVLHWKGNNTLKITYPPSLEQPYAKKLKPDSDVLGMFEEILRHSMARWIHSDIPRPSVELSSGLDSGIVAVIASSLTTNKLGSYGLLVMNELKAPQITRRNEFINKFRFDDTSINIEDYLPFSKQGLGMVSSEKVPWSECYYEAFGKMLSIAEQNNEKLLFTGIGGDELFYPYWDELNNEDQNFYASSNYLTREKVPTFIEDDSYRTYSETVNSIEMAPKSLMATSTLEAMAYTSPQNLRHNIWPVSPYCTPELIMFCRSLPYAWRKNRRLQREFLAKVGCSQKITNPKQPEDFGPVMKFALQKARLPVKKLIKNSYLADLGFIDPNKFMYAYDYHISHNNKSKHSDVDFYSVIALEYTMQTMDVEQTRNGMVI
ncbi:MAG: hypothetical protein COA50_16415 [Flavobacteriaceae bacterium]|nr:MAG: hypothetical protein COA50_16415 [Flavobacteriaceae bacterium]